MSDVVREADTFTDAGGVVTHFYRWRAENPRAVVQIVHGLGEHALRYEHVAQALCRAGYSVYAHDQRGHGATGLGQHGGDYAKLGRLGPGGIRATVSAIRELSRRISQENPGSALVLLGHSWGSLMVQGMLNQDMSAYAAVILTGTAYRMPGGMAAGDLSRRHRPAGGGTGFEWLSRDLAVQQAAAADPLMFPPNVPKLFGIPDALRLFGRPAKNVPHDLPLLIIVGDDDTLGGRASAHRLANAYRQRSGLSDVELVIYPGARHEVLAEINKDEVIAHIIAWLVEHTPRAPETKEKPDAR